MQRPILRRAGTAIAVCAVAGAGAGVAASWAAPGKGSGRQSTSTTQTAPGPGHHGRGPGFGFGRGFGAVHSEEVVPNEAGTAYLTRTEDSGTVKSISGADVTITEGTTKLPYKDVTVTIPEGATVLRNGAKAAVADLQAGDRIHVASDPEQTTVFAFDATFAPKGPGGRRHDHDRFPGGPPQRTNGTPPTPTTP